MQIIREASQKAVNHSRGRVDIILQHEDNQSIELMVEDNGIGIPPNAEQRNHSGLAVNNERSRHLSGQVDIETRQQGETSVRFSFKPSFLS